MRAEFSDQYQIVCLVLEPDDTFETVMHFPHLYEATFRSEDEPEYCVQFPDRPQELYTEEALRRSFTV